MTTVATQEARDQKFREHAIAVADEERERVGQYLIDRLRLDDPSLKAMNNLDAVFDVLIQSSEIDDVRTDKDFKWGMFLFKEILDAMREARVTNRYKDTTEKLVNELLCESSNYRAMLAIYNA